MKILRTNCGDIMGTELEDMFAYKGIRYATAGVFEYPKIVEKWDGVYDATEYKSCCYQQRAFFDEKNISSKAFYHKEFREGIDFKYSNDCLFLNIWTPKNVTDMSDLPVIFYIHGGSFTGGSGNEKPFDGPAWCKNGVIAVTINYRVGPWGFICLPELKKEAGHTGNYALFDMLTALTWVKNNIKEFGGNPYNITLFGQSTGAIGVSHLSLTPLSKGLFHKAIMSSGGGLSPFSKVSKAPEKHYWFWEKVRKETGCDTLEGLRNVEPKKLYECYEKVKNEDIPGMICFPCFDGVFFTKTTGEYMKAKEFKNIPYLIGFNNHDMIPSFLYKVARNWCMNVGNGKTYCYCFMHDLPGDEKKGAWHSADLWYWFGTLEKCWRPFKEADYKLSEQMVSYLCNFAKNGNPNGEGLPIWEETTKYNKKIMMIGNENLNMGNPSLISLFKTSIKKKAAEI